MKSIQIVGRFIYHLKRAVKCVNRVWRLEVDVKIGAFEMNRSLQTELPSLFAVIEQKTE